MCSVPIKTGTLTEGVVHLDGAVDTEGTASGKVFRSAYLNASLQTGLANALDTAILNRQQPDITGVEKLGEIPYDFHRKRLSVITMENDRCRMITKGAFGQYSGNLR